MSLNHYFAYENYTSIENTKILTFFKAGWKMFFRLTHIILLNKIVNFLGIKNMPISIDTLQRIADNDASLTHLDLSQQELSCSDINLLYQFLESNTFIKSLKCFL